MTWRMVLSLASLGLSAAALVVSSVSWRQARANARRLRALRERWAPDCGADDRR